MTGGRRVRSKPLLLLAALLFICISLSSVLLSVLADPEGQMQTAADKNRPYVLLGCIVRGENGTSVSAGPIVMYLDQKTGAKVGGDVTQVANDAISNVANSTVGNANIIWSRRGDIGGSTTVAQPRSRGMGMAGEFLRAHNEARQKAGMPPLKWDRNLSRYARRYGMKRKGDCAMTHSDDSPYGENIFWGYSSGWKPSKVVELWVEEQKDYDSNSNSCKAGMTCGHYTQVMWKTSERLGCSKVVCDSGDVFVNCNYDPPGNYQGINPFVGVVV